MALKALFITLVQNASERSKRSHYSSPRAVSALAAIALSLIVSSGTPAQVAPNATGSADGNLVLLGEQLFRSPLFSRDASVSCSTCHIPALGFSGDRPLAIGVAGNVSSRRAPSLFDLRDTKDLMWDGRAPNLRSQAALPLESPEMATRWPLALSRLNADATITELSQRAGLTTLDREACLAALAAYVASLTAGISRFDRYYYHRETNALTTQEAWGLRLFMRKARCASCHLVDSRRAPFTDSAFHATGIGSEAGAFADRGRAAISGDPADEGAFKTPSLRGVALRPYLMHDGSINTLRQAVEYYNRGISNRPSKVDDRLNPLHLTNEEIDAVVAFLVSLTPENSIDPTSLATVR